MFYKLIGLLVFAAMVALPRIGYSQGELVPSQIHNSVYEVIVAKPPEESVTYEKPLPMDLIPFVIRNDQYYSIGTAFAVSEVEFITAAHVMGLGKSQLGEIFLRDVKGNVFRIDKINKFSSRRDFAVFTVKERLSKEHLKLNPHSQINEKVYAVGNALGQGVIIRDGLYTSNTPEEVDGAWKWIRFSAAASPGNSGGPLLDQNGKVIGIVLQKSQNENLNMALPIAEVEKADPHQAEFYQKAGYKLDIFDSVKTGTLDAKVKLPMGYNEFKNTLITIRNEFNGKLLRELIAENKESIFPLGEGSKKLIYKNSVSHDPQLIMKRTDGNWDAIAPPKMEQSELGNNGRITFGVIKSTSFLKIQKPDQISLKDFYSDSKLFMDLILKSLPFARTVGPERIRITSLGKADNDYLHTDSYGRKWLVKTWPIPYIDQEIVTFSLPVPGGAVTMMRLGQTGEALDEHLPDLKVLADFVYVSLNGTFKQWREYLGMKELMPSVFNQIELAVNEGHLRYKSKRLEVSYQSDVIKIHDQSILTLGLGYYQEGPSFVWDVTNLYLNEDRFRYNGISISRNIKATEELGDEHLDHWKKLVEGIKPYDMKTHLIKDNTAISTVYKNFPTIKTGDPFSVLYEITYVKTGMVDQKEMESNLNKLTKHLRIYEK